VRFKLLRLWLYTCGRESEISLRGCNGEKTSAKQIQAVHFDLHHPELIRGRCACKCRSATPAPRRRHLPEPWYLRQSRWPRSTSLSACDGFDGVPSELERPGAVPHGSCRARLQWQQPRQATVARPRPSVRIESPILEAAERQRDGRAGERRRVGEQGH